MKATVTSKGQVTIPLRIRRRLKLRTGTVLEFDEKAGYLKAARRVDLERMKTAIGTAREELAGKSVAQWLDVLRGPVELPARRRRR